MTPIELAAAAAELAARGLPVFPCAGDKKPVTAHGFKDAVKDPAVARRLFLNTSGAEIIGVPTGAASGLTVIDVDPQGMAWHAAKFTRLPETRMHRTRRGGYHLLYLCPTPQIRNSAGLLACGVDIRGEGGYVCFPPSPGYEVVHEAEPVPFPRWVVAALARRGKKRSEEAARKLGPGEATAGGDVAALERWVSRLREGERNCGVFWAACRAGESGNGGAERALVTAAMAAGLDEVEAARTVKGGIARGRAGGARS